MRIPQLLRIAAGRNCQEGVTRVPELMAVVAKDERMRRPRQDNELAVGVGQLPEKIEQILLAGDPVMLAAHDHDRRLNLARIDDRQVRRHVQVGSGRHLIAESELSNSNTRSADCGGYARVVNTNQASSSVTAPPRL